MKIRFTPEALAEFRDVFEYIKGQSSQGAINVNAHIQRVLANLIEHPFSGTMTSLAEMRRIVIKPYPYLIFIWSKIRRSSLSASDTLPEIRHQ